MTAAEFKTIRERLGLTAKAFGLLLPRQVQERTVRYWESGEQPLPEDAIKLLCHVDAYAEENVARTLGVVHELSIEQETRPVSLHLLRYAHDDDIDSQMRPLGVGFHTALVGRTREALERAGVTVRIVKFDRTAFTQWSNEQGLSDNEASRSAWAAQQDG